MLIRFTFVIIVWLIVEARAAEGTAASADVSSSSSVSSETSVDILGRKTTVTASQCDASDQCQCTVNAPLPCSYDVEYAELVRVRRQLDLVYAHASGSIVHGLQLDLADILARMTTLEVSLHNQSISVSMSELSGLQDQVSNIQSSLQLLTQSSNSTVTQQLVAEVERIRVSLQGLGTKNPIAVKADLDKEIAVLRSRLASCSTITSVHGEENLDFMGDGLPANQTITADHCPATRNITIGSPVTYKFRSGVPGIWLKDPLPTSEAAKTRIYETRHSYTTNQYLYRWNNLDDYENRNFLQKATRSHCAFHIYGQKPLMLAGNWYWYNSYSSNRNLHKMDVFDSRCSAITSPVRYPHTSHDYSGNTYTDVDLNFDETGLYALHADVNGELNIHLLNKDTLAKEKEWNTGKRKSALAGAFMICGRVYTFDDHTARHLTGFQWGYDTTTSEEFFFKVDIESKYGDIKALSYNPREKALFGWDGFHAVLYPVFF